MLKNPTEHEMQLNKNKMRKYILLTAFVFQCLNILAQDWLPTGNGTNNGGNGGITLQAYNGMLIAGGAFSQAGTVTAKGSAMWDGTAWSIVDSTKNSFFAVRPLVIFRGQLYGFVSQFGDPSGYMIRLDSNFKWHYVPNSDFYDGNYSGNVFSAAVYHDELYVGGRFDSIGNIQANHIARWDGTNWATVGQGIDSEHIYGMIVYDNDLYVGGAFDVAGNVAVNHLARWNGSAWRDVGGGITGPGYYGIYGTMEAYKDELYIGGGFENAGGQPMSHLTKWNGSAFSSVGGGPLLVAGPGVFTVFGNRLIMGGNVGSGMFQDQMGTWDGVNFDSLGTGLSSTPTDFEIYNCQLYAGGRFTTTGNGVANGVAVLDTIDCSVDVQEINVPDYSISIAPNPFSSLTTISFSILQRNTTIKIIDIFGKEIESFNFLGSQFVINKGGLKAGIYFVQVTDNKKNVTNRKIVVQ
jgi:hypothetical protein